MSRGSYKKLRRKEANFLCSDKIIISTKEARKILGKEASEKMPEEDLTRLIGMLHKIADGLIDSEIVPKNNMVYNSDNE